MRRRRRRRRIFSFREIKKGKHETGGGGGGGGGGVVCKERKSKSKRKQAALPPPGKLSRRSSPSPIKSCYGIFLNDHLFLCSFRGQLRSAGSVGSDAATTAIEILVPVSVIQV